MEYAFIIITSLPLLIVGILLILHGMSERRRSKSQLEWVAYMQKKYPWLKVDSDHPMPDAKSRKSGIRFRL